MVTAPGQVVRVLAGHSERGGVAGVVRAIVYTAREEWGVTTGHRWEQGVQLVYKYIVQTLIFEVYIWMPTLKPC